MNSRIRLEGKALLVGNCARLFLISALSFILRYGAVTGTAILLSHIYKKDIIASLTSQYPPIAVYVTASLLSCILVFIVLMLTSGVRLGESYIYSVRIHGGTGSVKHLFRYLKPSDSFKAMCLFVKLNTLRIMWLVYFLLPCVILYFTAQNFTEMFGAIKIMESTLMFIFLFILYISLCVFFVCTSRYTAAPYLLCNNMKTSINSVIKKSILYTDAFLTEKFTLTASLFGWLLSCVVIIPAVYVIPYIKLENAIFASEALQQGRCPRSRFAVNIIGISM
ncbi:MAG: hypothetical protein IIX14_05235 [Clostridia bacterium]|nr:hypothetical protein [Clostridia bacterium]